MKQNKLMALVGRRIRLVLIDGRTLLGQLLAFDTHLNLCIADCEEFRPTKRLQSLQRKRANRRKNGQDIEVEGDEQFGQPMAPLNDLLEPATPATLMRRTLGFVVLRGQHIVSIAAGGAPIPADANRVRIPASQSISSAQPAVPMPGMMPSQFAAPPPRH